MTSNKFFHPHNHPGYSANLSIAENVRRGHRYNKNNHYPYLETSRQARAEATVLKHASPAKSRHFNAIADEAERLHIKRELR